MSSIKSYIYFLVIKTKILFKINTNDMNKLILNKVNFKPKKAKNCEVAIVILFELKFSVMVDNNGANIEIPTISIMPLQKIINAKI